MINLLDVFQWVLRARKHSLDYQAFQY